MTIQSKCPCCGCNTSVSLMPEEEEEYLSKQSHIHPDDFLARSICECCADDGFRIESRMDIPIIPARRRNDHIIAPKFRQVAY